MTKFISDIAFTPSVKSAQEKCGSRRGYQAMAEKTDWKTEIDADLAGFIAERNSLYLATASADGQPYIQHRGGPKGFLKVIDNKTLAFADFSGNRQYVSLGNLAENDKAYIFLMNYADKQRIKLWGRARFVEDDAELMERLVVEGYKARPERALVFEVIAWDKNCPQHIPQKHDFADVEIVSERLITKISELEKEIARLKENRAPE